MPGRVQADGRFEGLRVGLIGPAAPPAGGMANQTRQLGELLAAEWAEVQRVVTNAPYRPAWVGRRRGLRAVFRLAGYLGALWRAAGQCDVFHLMANSGWNWHLFAAPAIAVARLRGVPVIVNYRGGGAGEFLARSAAPVRFMMQRAAALVVPSGFLVEVFARHGMAAEVVPNIIDVARFARRGPRQGASAHIAVARHLEPLYDNATALRAFRLLHAQWPHARLTVAGEGPEETRLRALAAELDIASAVRFAGPLGRDAMAALMAGADLSLNPSLADNMPNSVLEAMACGVPVVSTAVGGVPFVVHDGRTGLLVPPSDPAAMAAAMQRALAELGLWQRLADAAYDDVQRYTWAQVSTRLAAVYAAATAGRQLRSQRSIAR